MSMSTIPPEANPWQLARKDEYDAGGLYAFCIAGTVICGITVILRLWSRKLQKMQWQSDDYTLIAAMILTVGSMVCFLVMIDYGFGRHYFSLSHDQQVRYSKTRFSFNILYTIAYPLSRISLVLLYRRIFVQQWFRIVCLIFIAIFTCFAIATALTDVFLTIPVNAQWDHTVKARHTVDQKKLFVGNAGFNIATDTILLVLPIIIISRLQMNLWHKVGVSAIFCLGTLTIIATICRLHYFYSVDELDVTYTLVKDAYWTAAEQFLGILCPCLVTFRPLIRSSYLLFSRHRSSSSSSLSWFPSRRAGSHPKPSSEDNLTTTATTTTTTALNAEEQDHSSSESIPQFSSNTTRRGYLEMDLEAQRKHPPSGLSGFQK